ncbi:Elongator complex protein 4 [Neolecta irregularis DAH-3]|uniref:Elongator complex protein 4 n=1 Tax=Neolecta irregularis (strain DAH-3) TaxID=1198029 RepID=A0A1U7LGA2_NEOID|nr:Elongator complex protein 4 [Neolecta irregularis DAH-3]|eukprot:OLL21677.1 Elongator complex protein 4 [Neolecta irregularis DAH-3]
MSFQRRQVKLSGSAYPETSKSAYEFPKGVRPSYINGKATTSTGCPSLDAILVGGGLALGTCLLIEESGSTDFASALLRYFAAQGVVHEHALIVCGVEKSWVGELPGINEKLQRANHSVEKMKIAWRYNDLGSGDTGREREQGDYCNTFDLTRRLDTTCSNVTILRPDFQEVLAHVEKVMGEARPHVHRVVLPGLLSPLQYDQTARHPGRILRFLHSLRLLLQRYPTRLAVMMTLPVYLYPRTSAIVGWMEILADGVLELVPLPAAGDGPQGVVRVLKLPETNVSDEHYEFRVSRRGFSMETWSFGVVGEEQGTEDRQPDKLDF